MHLYTDMEKAAKEVFQVDKLLPFQRRAIENTLSGQRQIVILPTGYGKSLCFLIPAVMLEGITLIIYPLLALMADQKRRMDRSALKALVLKGGQSKKEREEVFTALEGGQAKVLIANPEVLQIASVQSRLSACRISHIAVDEAHCVSEWGESFRPAYTKLGGIIARLAVRRVTALTATASPPVLARIQELLFPHEKAEILRGPLDRANLRYQVLYAADREKALLKTLLTARRPCLVFCGTRKKSEDCARMLSAFFHARFYHAGMTRQEKKAVEDWFFTSRDGILCCTSAYGMGVDKADIRTCIHLVSPEKIEFFIQEAGRAGRDRKEAHSIVIWSPADKKKHPAMAGYALASSCRRQFLLDYLDGEKTACSGCDICNTGSSADLQGRLPRYSDMEKVFQWIYKNRRLYREEEALLPLQTLMNESDNPFTEAIWDSRDIQEILKCLKEERRIRLFHGHLDVAAAKKRKTCRRNKRLIRLQRHLRHRLYCLRRLLRQLAQLQERLQLSF